MHKMSPDSDYDLAIFARQKDVHLYKSFILFRAFTMRQNFAKLNLKPTRANNVLMPLCSSNSKTKSTKNCLFITHKFVLYP